MNAIIKAKNDGLKTSVGGREITLDNTESLLRHRHWKNKWKQILKRVQQYCWWCGCNTTEANAHKKSRKKGRNFITVNKEIPKSKDKELDEQPDTTAMPEIESEKSTEQGKKQTGQRLKILTPSQMLSRLPITLAQLKAGKNSEQRKKWNQATIVFFVPFKKINWNNLE